MTFAEERPTSTGFDDADLLASLSELLAYARYLTRDADRARDLVQDTAVSALANRAAYSPTPGSNLTAWLIVIMRNRFHSDLRLAYRHPTAPWDDAHSPPAPSLERSFEASRAIAATRYLTEEQVDLLSTAALSVESYDDTAVRLNLTVGAVRNRLQRARRALRELIGQPARTSARF